MIADKDDLLAAHDERDHTFWKGSGANHKAAVRLTWLGGLSSLVNQNRSELELCQSRVTTTDTGGADDIRSIQNISLRIPDEVPVPPLILRT